MKRFSFVRLSVAALALTGLLAACGTDTENPPSINLLSSGGCITTEVDTLVPGAAYCISIQAVSGQDGKDLKSLVVQSEFSSNPGVKIDRISIEFDRNTTVADTVYSGMASTTDGTSETITITVEDKDGLTDSKTVKIVSREPDGPPPVDVPTAIDSKVFASEYDGSVPPAYQASTSLELLATNQASPSVLTRTQASAIAGDIDVTYFYSAGTNTHNFVSPLRRTNSADYSVYALDAAFNNATEWRTTSLTATDFEARRDSADSYLEQDYLDGIPSQYINNANGERFGGAAFLPGTILAFYNGSKYGLLHISSVSATAVNVNILIED